MQNQKPFPVYGVSKTAYAQQVRELEERNNQPSTGGFFARFRKKAQ